jgi:hypothetical protein
MVRTEKRREPGGRVALVACSATKAKVQCAAREMYTSPLFRKSLAYALSIADGDTWIMSAEYGLIALDRVIHPYNRTLAGMGKEWVKMWGFRVVDELERHYLGVLQLVLLGGEDYTRPVREAAVSRGWPQPIEPLRGMQIGERLSWLTKHAPTEDPNALGQENPTVPRTLTPRTSLYYVPTEPYVSQYQSPLGWVVDLYDPKLSTTAPVQTVRPLKKFTFEEKRRMINVYKFRKEKGNG